MKLNNQTYDVLKWVFLIVFPALATLIGVLGQAWNIPHVEQVVISINAIGVFGGAVLGISSANYHKE